MMAYAEQIALDASAVTETQILDALGAEPDKVYWELEESLRQALIVGRPIAERC